jgi:hypothetical protein
MNRILLIGNGFDLAHGLKTSYKDFIDDFWEKRKKNISSCFKEMSVKNFAYIYEDDVITIQSPLPIEKLPNFKNTSIKGYGWFKHLQDAGYMGIINNRNIYFEIRHKNAFLEAISEKSSVLNWVDIEEEYYRVLYKCSEDKTDDNVKILNKEFLMIKESLESYLKEQVAGNINKSPIIEQNINSDITLEKILKKPVDDTLYYTLFLNFNYTSTEKMYIQNINSDKVIHIHGELGNHKNPVIFGYGDDIDEKYKRIEQLNNNEYLTNIKSIKYLETRNYQEMLKFIDVDDYVIYIMGLSCGNSDRTLLNTLFEHKNCLSIKVFFHQRDDQTNDYYDVVRNISRNFTDKSLFRKIVVDKTLCVPLS